MARFGRTDEIVVGQFQFFCKRFPIRCQLVAISLRSFAFSECGLLDFLSVFVEAGEKKNLLAEAAARTRADIRNDFFVGVAEMRLAVHVINRGRDKKAFAHFERTV